MATECLASSITAFHHMFPRNANTIPQIFYDTTLASSPDIQWNSISLQETQVDSVEHMGDTPCMISSRSLS